MTPSPIERSEPADISSRGRFDCGEQPLALLAGVQLSMCCNRIFVGTTTF